MFRFSDLVLILSACSTIVFAQQNREEWLRVVTGEELVIDVEHASLVLEQNGIVSARFRTRLEQEERVKDNPDLRYLSRVDRIQFDVAKLEYKIAKSVFFSRSNEPVLARNSEDWKPIRGRTADKLFEAAGQLSPFGFWQVLSYTYANGEGQQPDDPPELTALVGTKILLSLRKVRVGETTCKTPIFEPKIISDEESIRRTGSSIESLGIRADKLEVIFVKCGSPTSFPSTLLILRLSSSEALILWEGVFFKIQRLPHPFLSNIF